MSKSLEREYFVVQPEVAGGSGDGTITEKDTRPPRVIYLVTASMIGWGMAFWQQLGAASS